MLLLLAACADDPASTCGVLSNAAWTSAAEMPTVGTISADVAGPLDVSVMFRADGVPDLAIPGVLGADGAIEVPVRGLRAHTAYTATVSAGCAEVVLPVETGMLDAPDLELLDDDGSIQGLVLASWEGFGDLQGSGCALYDRDGVAVWNVGPTRGAIMSCEPLADRTGVRLLATEVDDYSTGRMEDYGWDGHPLAGWDIPEAHHTFTQRAPGIAFATLAQVSRVVPGIGEECGGSDDVVLGDAIVEVGLDGSMTEVWNAFDTLSPACHEGWSFTSTGGDWTHANGLDYDVGSDSWIVSLYWSSQVVAVDRATGAVRWSLGPDGGGTIGWGADGGTEHQHACEWVSGGFACFDNGHTPSRVARYAVADGDATLVAEWLQPDGREAAVMGDVDWTDDEIVTAWGEIGQYAIIRDGELAWRVAGEPGLLAQSASHIPSLY